MTDCSDVPPPASDGNELSSGPSDGLGHWRWWVVRADFPACSAILLCRFFGRREFAAARGLSLVTVSAKTNTKVYIVHIFLQISAFQGTEVFSEGKLGYLGTAQRPTWYLQM